MLARSVAWIAIAILLPLVAGAQSPTFPGFPPGVFQSRAALDAASAPPAYTGPGDVVSSATAWWGLRCYNSAYSGNVAAVWDAATGSTIETLLTCSAGGTINQTINPLSTTCAIACVVATLYDQSGGGNDIAQSTNSLRPVFTQSCIGSKPCMTFSTSKMATTGTFSLNQPFTYSSVAETSSTSSQSIIIDSGTQVQMGFNSSGAEIYAGTVLPSAASLNNFHAIQGIFNQSVAGSLIYVDGTATPGNAGAQTISTSTLILGDLAGGSQPLAGSVSEIGVWPIAFNSTQYAAMNGNQHSYWGF